MKFILSKCETIAKRLLESCTTWRARITTRFPRLLAEGEMSHSSGTIAERVADRYQHRLTAESSVFVKK